MSDTVKHQPRKWGMVAENKVCDYLKQQGLKCVTANYTCRMGEIDLIMYDKDVLVFIEVRMRNNLNYATGLESVDRRKQNKIIKTAKFYLQQRGLFDKVLCRFDVAEVSQNHITWIKNAF